MTADEILTSLKKAEGTEPQTVTVEAVSRSTVRAMLEENTRLFFEGLREADSQKTSSSLRTIAKYIGCLEDCPYVEREEEYIAVLLSTTVSTLDGIKGGKYDCNFFEYSFHPFLGTPDEMYKLAVKNCSHVTYRPFPLSDLLTGVVTFLGGWGNFPYGKRSEFQPYIKPWLKRVIEIAAEKYDDIIADDREVEPDTYNGPDALGAIIVFMMNHPDYEDLLRYTFSILGERIVSLEKATSCSPLIHAVVTGNIEVFEYMYSFRGIKDIVHIKRTGEGAWGYTAGEDTGEIIYYPESSTEMLQRLFELGILLPGTEEGKEAFFRNIERCNPTREIVALTKHPSYFSEDYGTDGSPLERALRGSFSPENYDLLIERDCDINRTCSYSEDLPLVGKAVGKTEKFMRLVELGADISWHDRWGNNVLHRYFCDIRKSCDDYELKDKDSIAVHSEDGTVDLVSFYRDNFPSLAEERNKCGKTPSDYLRRGEENPLSSLESLPFTSALDKIFSSSTTDCVFYMQDFTGDYPVVGRAVKLVGEYLFDRFDDMTVVSIRNLDELKAVEKNSADGKRRWAVLIPCIDRRSDEFSSISRRLLERDNVSVIAGECNSYGCSGITAEMADRKDMNVFVGKTENEYLSDMLLSRSGAEKLEYSQFILRRGNEYFLTDPDTFDREHRRDLEKLRSLSEDDD